ncbi:MAG: crossover junction endodeoxyribonuclease RuvC [Tissierellia bacterium]|nr:crossover junction endodeoxyribonuclease RuvC [Tissierellia bacterium]
MRILGIDPGLAIIGYGLIDFIGNKMNVIDYGCIYTESKLNLPDRLLSIHNNLTELIRTYSPDEAAIEELFFNKNVKTAITVGHARGVEILTCKIHGLNIYEYTPLQIKQAVVGYGRAEKHQVQEMVKMLLNLEEIPKPDDAADALAAAITHASSYNFKDSFVIR